MTIRLRDRGFFGVLKRRMLSVRLDFSVYELKSEG
jgi:hypothetical protein